MLHNTTEHSHHGTPPLPTQPRLRRATPCGAFLPRFGGPARRGAAGPTCSQDRTPAKHRVCVRPVPPGPRGRSPGLRRLRQPRRCKRTLRRVTGIACTANTGSTCAHTHQPQSPSLDGSPLGSPTKGTRRSVLGARRDRAAAQFHLTVPTISPTIRGRTSIRGFRAVMQRRASFVTTSGTAALIA